MRDTDYRLIMGYGAESLARLDEVAKVLIDCCQENTLYHYGGFDVENNRTQCARLYVDHQQRDEVIGLMLIAGAADRCPLNSHDGHRLHLYVDDVVVVTTKAAGRRDKIPPMIRFYNDFCPWIVFEFGFLTGAYEYLQEKLNANKRQRRGTETGDSCRTGNASVFGD